MFLVFKFHKFRVLLLQLIVGLLIFTNVSCISSKSSKSMKATHKRELKKQKQHEKDYKEIVKAHNDMQAETTKGMMKARKKKNKKWLKSFR